MKALFSLSTTLIALLVSAPLAQAADEPGLIQENISIPLGVVLSSHDRHSDPFGGFSTSPTTIVLNGDRGEDGSIQTAGQSIFSFHEGATDISVYIQISHEKNTDGEIYYLMASAIWRTGNEEGEHFQELGSLAVHQLSEIPMAIVWKGAAVTAERSFPTVYLGAGF